MIARIELVGREVTMPFLFLVPLDATSRIVGTPAPLDCQVEHTGEDSDGPIGLIGRGHTDTAMQGGNVAIGQRADPLTAEGRADVQAYGGFVVAR